MWSFNSAAEAALKAGAIVGILLLGGVMTGCSFSPLYGENAAATQLTLNYARPGDRLSQVIYQDLALRFGRTEGEKTPLVTVSVSAGDRQAGRTVQGLYVVAHEAIVSANVQVTRVIPDGTATQTLLAFAESASATYTINGQRLSDQQAQEDAQERAARIVAQRIALRLSAGLPAKL